jgi:nicotinamidase-related amidase
LEFYVTGLQSDFCVRATSKDLLEFYSPKEGKGRVVVVSGAHWTVDGEKTAKETANEVEEELKELGAEVVDISELVF